MINPRCDFCIPCVDCDWFKATERSDAGHELEEVFCPCSEEAKLFACCIWEAGSALADDKVSLDDRAAIQAAVGNLEGCDFPDFIERSIAVARHEKL
jgi:hypothetical protein